MGTGSIRLLIVMGRMGSYLRRIEGRRRHGWGEGGGGACESFEQDYEEEAEEAEEAEEVTDETTKEDDS
jgi:hypothetical protein